MLAKIAIPLLCALLHQPGVQAIPNRLGHRLTYTTYPVVTVTTTEVATITAIVPCGEAGPFGYKRQFDHVTTRTVRPTYYRNYTTTKTESLEVTTTIFESCSQVEPTEFSTWFPTVTGSPPEPTLCPEGYRPDTLIFDDFTASSEPVIIPESPFVYKDFTFDDNWWLASCNKLPFYLDQTCRKGTAAVDQYLSLHSDGKGTKPAYRRITYDDENEETSFILRSFYLSTKPLEGDDFASITCCGWTVEDQYNEGVPTWCIQTKLFGSAPFQKKVDINRGNLAHILCFGALNYNTAEDVDSHPYAMAKGNKPVEYQLDDIEVCIPQ